METGAVIRIAIGGTLVFLALMIPLIAFLVHKHKRGRQRSGLIKACHRRYMLDGNKDGDGQLDSSHVFRP